MNRILSWIKAHRTLTALGAFVLLWIIVSQSSGVAPLTISQTSRSSGGGTSGLAVGEPAVFMMNADIAEEAMMDSSVSSKAGGLMPSPVPHYEPTAGDTAAVAEQRIIKTGNITAVFPNIDDAIADLTMHASDVGGFIEHSSISENRSGVRSGYLTMRVPVDAFESSLSHVRSLAGFVRNESVDGQDVTEQYTDIEARLSNAREQEKAYLVILNRANSVEDILSVQRELGNIRAQIESYEGRLKYLGNRTAYSTINVNLEEDVSIQIPTEKFQPLTTAKEAVSALINAFQGLATSLIWTVILGLGLLLPALFVIWVLYRIIKRFWWKK